MCDRNDKCHAKKATGGLCEAWAGAGTNHPKVGKCFRHGGASPTGVRSAARTMVMAMATEADADPLEVLLKTIRVAWGSVSWISQRIQDDYGDEPHVLEEAQRMKGGEEQTYLKKSEFVVWQQLLGEWTDRAAKFSKMALDAGVAERVIKVEEQRGALLAGVIKVILNGLVLTPEQQNLAPELVRRALLEIA